MILLLLIKGTLQMCLQIFNVPCWFLEEYIYIIDNIEIWLVVSETSVLL